MSKLLFTLTLISSLMLCSKTSFGAEDEDGLSYDAIINQLNTQKVRTHITASNPFSDIKMHAGVGFAMSTIDVGLNGYQNDFAQGVEVNLGIDLFSRTWEAEGSFRTLSNPSFDRKAKLTLSEFDLKIVNTPYSRSYFSLRVGGGLAARYLEFKENQGDVLNYKTPSSILFVGMNALITPGFSAGIEGSLRSSFIDDTIDKNAFQASIRLDSHF